MFFINKNFLISAIFILFLYIPTAFVLYSAVTKKFIPLEEFAFIRFIILLLFAPIILKYVIHLLIAPWYPFVEKYRSKNFSKSYAPLVSVLVPARNEEIGIAQTLRSIVNVDYPDVEIVVINDGSTDSTHDIIVKFIKSNPKANIVYVQGSQSGKAGALNSAISKTRGEIIITIDSDSIMDKNFIRRIIPNFSDSRVASVAGNVIIGNRFRPIGIIQQLEYLYGFYFKRADTLLNAVYIVGGAAAAYRKSVVISLGGFNEEIITEDIELSTRLQERGYKVRYVADAFVYTEGPANLEGLCKQRLRWKFGRLLTFFKYRKMFFSFNKRHNPYLSFLILPIALFAEVLLFFEGFLLAAFYAYTFLTNDYLPLAIVIIFLSGLIFLQIVSDRNAKYHRNLLVIAPGAWLLFYIMDFVEYQALLRSIWKIVKNQKVTWQTWARSGVFGSMLK